MCILRERERDVLYCEDKDNKIEETIYQNSTAYGVSGKEYFNQCTPLKKSIQKFVNKKQTEEQECQNCQIKKMKTCTMHALTKQNKKQLQKSWQTFSPCRFFLSDTP